MSFSLWHLGPQMRLWCNDLVVNVALWLRQWISGPWAHVLTAIWIFLVAQYDLWHISSLHFINTAKFMRVLKQRERRSFQVNKNLWFVIILKLKLNWLQNYFWQKYSISSWVLNKKMVVIGESSIGLFSLELTCKIPVWKTSAKVLVLIAE